MKNCNKREKFALKSWKLFDELLRDEFPDIPPQWRYEMAQSWDKVIFDQLKKLDILKRML